MNATPRPWYLAASPDYPDAEIFVVGNPDWNGTVQDGPIICSAGTADGHEQWERQNLELIVTAVNAFDALLAAAKAAGLRANLTGGFARQQPGYEEALVDCDLAVIRAVLDLDAAHPGWREWA